MSDIYAYISDNEISVTVVNDDINVYFETGQPGLNGWTPVFSIVADGSSREVLRVVDWIGGGGTKPTTGQYVGPTGFVALIGDGVNIKGASGTETIVSVVPGTIYSVTAGKWLVGIAPIPEAGARTLSAGYSAGTTELLDTEEIPSNQAWTFNLMRRFNSTQNIHFSLYTGDLAILTI